MAWRRGSLIHECDDALGRFELSVLSRCIREVNAARSLAQKALNYKLRIFKQTGSGRRGGPEEELELEDESKLKTFDSSETLSLPSVVASLFASLVDLLRARETP